MGSLLECFEASFWVLGRRVCAVCEKVLFQLFWRGKSKGLLVQNHANRTVYPLKIEDQLSIAYVFLLVFQRAPFWPLKACLGASNQTLTSMFFSTLHKVFVLDCLGASWGSNLSSSGMHLGGTQTPKFGFFLVLSRIRCFSLSSGLWA